MVKLTSSQHLPYFEEEDPLKCEICKKGPREIMWKTLRVCILCYKIKLQELKK